jgi:nucleoside-diphosphate-sugar epimerase
VERQDVALQARDLARVLAGSDVLVHAAGLNRSPSSEHLLAANERVTREVVHAANAVGVRVVLVSSQAAGGTGTPERPRREDDAPRPMTPYGRSKLAGEAVVRSLADVPWTILRPSSVYGPRDRQFLPLFKLAVRGIFPLVASPAAAFTVIYVEDLARAVVLAASDRERSGDTLFLGHSEAPGADALLSALAAAVGRPYRPTRLSPIALRAVAFLGDLSWKAGREPLLDTSRLAELQSEGFVCAVDRARDILGFTAGTPLDAGLERTAAWYRDAGWLSALPGAPLRTTSRRSLQ